MKTWQKNIFQKHTVTSPPPSSDKVTSPMVGDIALVTSARGLVACESLPVISVGGSVVGNSLPTIAIISSIVEDDALETCVGDLMAEDATLQLVPEVQ